LNPSVYRILVTQFFTNITMLTLFVAVGAVTIQNFIEDLAMLLSSGF